MEQKFQIPEMSTEEIAKWYATIKPIVRQNGIPYYLRKLSIRELTRTAYTYHKEYTDYDECVDYNKLSVIADIKMLHTYNYYGFFKPTVGEVIRQIPKQLLTQVVAFEIIIGAVGMNSIYKAELNAGYHVSVVRLYQTKSDGERPASPIEYWPTKYSICPLGMTEPDFHEIIKIMKSVE